MIKLERGSKPEKLSEDAVKVLTQKFKRDNSKRVWHKDYLLSALRDMSHNKCCYCEVKLDKESNYLTIDHFYNKSKYPDKVVEWENLLPCCQRCNSAKGSHDTYKIPIIDPTKDDPKEHLYFYNYNYKYFNGSSLGKNTINVLNLNETERVLYVRAKVGQTVIEKLELICELIDRYIPDGDNVAEKNRIMREIKGILSSALPDKEYSALVATVILEDENYSTIREKMIQLDLWNTKLDDLELSAKKICLSRRDDLR